MGIAPILRLCFCKIRISSCVLGFIALTSTQLICLEARADIKVRAKSGLNTKINGRLNGSCRKGVCRISGGQRGGKRNRLLFHRLKQLDTRGKSIKKIKLNLGNKKVRSVFLGVTDRKGAFLDTPFVLSGKADLIVLAPGGLNINGASFRNVNNLTFAASSRVQMDAGRSFDLLKTSAEQVSTLRLPNDVSLSESSKRFLPSGNRHSGKDLMNPFDNRPIKVSGLLSVDRDLLVVAEQPIHLTDSHLSVGGDVHIESRLSRINFPTKSVDVLNRDKRLSAIQIDNVRGQFSGDLGLVSRSGSVGRSVTGLSVFDSDLSAEGDLHVSAKASPNSPFSESTGIDLRSSNFNADSIGLKGRGGSSSDQILNRGIDMDNTSLIAAQRISMVGKGGDGRKHVQGIVLRPKSTIKSLRADISIKGLGGDDAGIGLQGLLIDSRGNLVAQSDLKLFGVAGSSRAPHHGSGIYIGNKTRLKADNVLITGIGSDLTDSTSRLPVKQKNQLKWNSGVFISPHTHIKTSGNLQIDGEGGYGHQFLDGVSISGSYVVSKGDVSLFGISGYGDTIQDSFGLYLEGTDIKAKNIWFTGFSSDDNEKVNTQLLDGIHLGNSNVVAKGFIDAFGQTGTSQNMTNSAGFYAFGSTLKAGSMWLLGKPGAYSQIDGRNSNQSGLTASDRESKIAGQSSGKNVGLWLKESTLRTSRGDLYLTGVGGDGKTKLHGIWLDKTTVNAKNGVLDILGESGSGGRRMYGVFARNSDLKAQQHAILNGRSMDSPLGSNNIGIKINDSSQLTSPDILLHGEGGNSKGLGQILDGVLVQNARLNASNKLDVVGYAGTGSNVQQSNGIGLYDKAKLIGDKINLRGYGVPKDPQDISDQQAISDQRITDKIDDYSDGFDNHGIAINESMVKANHSLVLKGDAGFGQKYLDGVHMNHSDLFSESKLKIIGKGNPLGNSFEHSSGIYSHDTRMISDGLLKLAGDGGLGERIKKSHGIELSSSFIDGMNVKIVGNGGGGGRLNRRSAGVVIFNNSFFNSDHSMSVRGSGGNAFKVDYGTGIVVEDSTFDSSGWLHLRGLSGYGFEKMKESLGIHLKRSKLKSDSIRLVGKPGDPDKDTLTSAQNKVAWGELNQGIAIRKSRLKATDQLVLRGVGGEGISQLDGIFIQYGSLKAGQHLNMTGEGGSGTNLHSTAGIIALENSSIQSPSIYLKGKGGVSTIQNVDSQFSDSYYNDGIYLEESTVSTLPLKGIELITRERPSMVLQGFGGEIRVEGDVPFARGDLNSGVVLWDVDFIGASSSRIFGYAGKPPKGNLNTGVEIRNDSNLRFISDPGFDGPAVSLFGKAFSGNDKNTAVKIKDSQLSSPFADLKVVGKGAKQSDGRLNQGVRLIDTSVAVGDSNHTEQHDFFLAGYGGRGNRSNSGVYVKGKSQTQRFDVTGSIFVKGKIREDEWRKHPSVFINNVRLSAGENLNLIADRSVKLRSTGLDAGNNLFMKAYSIELQDTSIQAGDQISIQAEQLSVDLSQIVEAAYQSDDQQSDQSVSVDDAVPSKSSQLSQNLTLQQIEQQILMREQTAVSRLSRTLGLERIQPMGLSDIQRMLRSSMQRNFDSLPIQNK
jgi:hypothetical protein